MWSVLLLSLTLSGCGRQKTACEGFPSISEQCGWYEVEGERVCGCPVETDGPYCTAPDPRARIGVSFRSGEDDRWHLGTWPALPEDGSCPTDAELGPELVDRGSVPGVGAAGEREWSELAWSPDGRYAALYELTSPGRGRGASLLACEDGDDPGWMVEHIVDPVTSPFVRWGSGTGEERSLYLMADDLYRLRVDLRPTLGRPEGGGEPVEILVLEEAERLARSEPGRLAFGDFDVSFDASGDHYLVFLSALDASLVPLYTRAAIYVMDLSDCDPECDDSQPFCCRTALLVIGDTDYPDVPTNPVLTADGQLIALNRFTTDAAQCRLCAQEHVLYNPLADATRLHSWCGAEDGLHEAIDCTPMFGDAQRWDPARCPDHQCCDQEGVDCSRCISFGEQPGVASACGAEGEGVRERNYAFFFQLQGATWMGFRSADLLGDLQTELHAYRLDFAPDGSFLPAGERIELPVSGFEGAAVSTWGPAPWHHLDDPCR